MGGGIRVKEVMDTTSLDHVLMWGVTGCRIANYGVGAILNGGRYASKGDVVAHNGEQLCDRGGPSKVVANNIIHEPRSRGYLRKRLATKLHKRTRK